MNNLGLNEEEIEELLAEVSDLLEEAEKGLMSLDQGELVKDHYDPIFRALHSIKGAAGLLENPTL